MMPTYFQVTKRHGQPWPLTTVFLTRIQVTFLFWNSKYDDYNQVLINRLQTSGLQQIKYLAFWVSIIVAAKTISTFGQLSVSSSAWKMSIRRFVITEKAPIRAFSWLKAATTAFTFKTLLRHYAKRALTPRSLNVKLGPRRKGHKGLAFWLA